MSICFTFDFGFGFRTFSAQYSLPPLLLLHKPSDLRHSRVTESLIITAQSFAGMVSTNYFTNSENACHCYPNNFNMHDRKPYSILLAIQTALLL